jgi:hypothetical protein
LRGRSKRQHRTRKLILMTVAAASDAAKSLQSMQAARQLLEA